MLYIAIDYFEDKTFSMPDDFGPVFWHLIMITKYNELTNMTT